MTRLIVIISVIVVGLAILAWEAFFIVEPHQAMIVLQFGEPKKVSDGPGLYTKVPFMQNVVEYDMRARCFEVPTEQVITNDKKRLMVDAHIVYRVVDPVAFYKRLRTQELACQRMHALTVSALRGFVGQASFEGFLKERRQSILDDVQRSLAESTKDFGVTIVDVRVWKAELPEQNSQAIYRRMISERTRIAKQVRAEGQEKALKMKAHAEKEASRIVSDARKRAITLEAESNAYACGKHTAMARKDQRLYRVYKGASFVKRNLAQATTHIVASTKDSALLMPLRDVILAK